MVSDARAADVPALSLEERNPAACARISREIEAVIAEEGAETIVLGCAGMADLASELSIQHGLPVIDGVTAAVGLMEPLVRLGHRTSRLGAWRPSPLKPYARPLADFTLG